MSVHTDQLLKLHTNTKWTPKRGPRPVKDYNRSAVALRVCQNHVMRLIVDGSKLLPSQWYDEVDDLYESLAEAERIYGEQVLNENK